MKDSLSSKDNLIETHTKIIVGAMPLNIWLIAMANSRVVIVGSDCTDRRLITTRTSWMANNAIPDSITTNMICRSLVPPVAPKVCSPTEVVVVFLTSMNTLRILNTIKPVTRVFTAMDAASAVRVTGEPS